MFGDFGWKYNQSQCYIQWELWRETIVEVLKDAGEMRKVCVVEDGCAKNVDTCRNLSEQIIMEIQEQLGETFLIRINHDEPFSSDPKVSMQTIPILSRGLDAIERIDEIMRKKVPQT
jgi:hypothetical protein